MTYTQKDMDGLLDYVNKIKEELEALRREVNPECQPPSKRWWFCPGSGKIYVGAKPEGSHAVEITAESATYLQAKQQKEAAQ